MDGSEPTSRGDRAVVVKLIDRIESIEHYGTKGMRWGVRKSESSKEPASADSTRATELQTRAKASGTKALTNVELQAAINRLNLEQQYSRVRPRSKKEKAVKWVAETLLGIGKEQASKFAREQVGDVIKKAA